MQAIIDPLQKLLTGTNPVRLARQMQPIVRFGGRALAARTEMHCFVHRETVREAIGVARGLTSIELVMPFIPRTRRTASSVRSR